MVHEKEYCHFGTDGFEESELKSPKEAIEKEGFKVDNIAMAP